MQSYYRVLVKRQRKGEDMNQQQKAGVLGCLILIVPFLFFMYLVKSCTTATNETRPVSQVNQQAAIAEANNVLSGLGIAGTYATQFEGDYLVVRITFPANPPASPQAYGESVCLAVRNRLVLSPNTAPKSYRVSLYGPPPGPGLVRTYGSYRFTEGYKGTWKDN